MKPSPMPTPDALLQAEHWFARLRSDDCSAAERREFQNWHRLPEHAAAWRRTEALWRDAGALKQHASIQELSAEVLAQTAPQRGWAGARRVWALAASVAVVTIGTVIGLQLREQAGIYTTALGEQRTIALEDGSRVTLNTQTRLRVRFNEHRRELALLSGEALFDVAHDAGRPFLVSAGLGSVTALGTRFQVRREVGEVQVTLLEGRVRVDAAEAAAPVEMAPGEQVRIAKTEKTIERRKVDGEATLSWTSGRLIFRATPLSEAVAEVNRYARTKIRIADPALAALRISGTFVTGDSELLAAALQTDMPIKADFSGDGEIVLRRR